MNTRRAALTTLGATILGAAPTLAAPAEVGLRLSLPASTSQRDRRYLRLKGFHLVITNPTSSPVAVWRDWCSWGWFCPSVSIELGGKHFTFKKSDKRWSKNYPDAFWIYPGEHYVLPIRLLGDDWVQPDGFSPDFDTPATVSIAFTIPEDPETKELGVWTGTLKVTQKLLLDAATDAKIPD